jgi:hypothetical protein
LPRLCAHAWSGASRRLAQSGVALEAVAVEQCWFDRAAGAAWPGTTAGFGTEPAGFVPVSAVVGSGPYRTPGPTASHGSTSAHPACSTLGSLSEAPSGCVRPELRTNSSAARFVVPRNRWEISDRFSGAPW